MSALDLDSSASPEFSRVVAIAFLRPVQNVLVAGLRPVPLGRGWELP
jgi:hypothetical protein